MFSFSKKVVLSFCFVLLSVYTQGQAKVKQFSNDPNEFLEEIYQLFIESDPVLAEGFRAEFKAVFPLDSLVLKKRIKVYKKATKAQKIRYRKLKIKSDFAYRDTTAKFSNYQIDAIVKTCDQMMVNRLKAIPHFAGYFNTLLSFINTNQSEESFEAWNIALNKLLSENKRHFNTFITNCNNIFLYRSVYVSSNVRWIRTSDKFTFRYDSLPKVIFPKMDLYCLAKGDTAFIYNTEGSYYLTKGIWQGKGGKVLWTRAGIKPSVSYALLKNYRIDMKSSFYTADSVLYTNKKYFPQEVQGRLEEKLLAKTRKSVASFPQFYSYSGRVKIAEVEKNVDYEGGFLIKGAKLIGKEASGVRAKLTFKRNNKPFLIADANSFTMSEEKISTNSAKVVMLLEEDSIFHPSLKMKFLLKKRELTLYRQEKGLGAAPYSNSYHKMDMYLEWLQWEIDKPTMEFTTLVGSSNQQMVLESSNYYSAQRFNNLQGLQDVHPLYIIRQFVEEKNNGDRVCLDTDISAHFTLDDNSIQRLLIKFANMGFVLYDINKGVVTIQQRLFDYLDAKSKKSDYDNITVISDIKGKSNAVLNLDSYQMDINGVRSVVLSKVRTTGFIPKGRHIVLSKNRDMTFDGILRSGNYEFHGKQFSFSYDSFNIALPSVDSVRLKAADRRMEKKGEQSAYTMVNSVIENVQGKLIIDPPNNKSGIHIDSFPAYPKLISTGNSYVKYNKRNKRGNAYDPQKVFFKLDPFEVDSLGTFTNDGVQFAGTFVSGGIFNDLQENLGMMPDHSLGFSRTTEYDGEPVYGGKATFKNKINVSNQGIMGDGDFEYITSVAKSTDFIFYPDSMNAFAQEFTLDEITTGVEYPDVDAKNVNVHYEPNPDFMKVRNTTFPMTMYNYEARLDGELTYNREAMIGSGVIDFDNAELTSNLFDFKNTKFMADTADFKLKSESDVQGIAFETKNMNSTIDLKKREGDFVANDGASYVNFPINQYVCYMDQFKWFMDDFTLELSSTDATSKEANTGAGGNDLDLSGAEFISTHPDQDSLKFISPKANYYLKDNTIKAHEVKYINVADARIYTGDGEIEVRKGADMKLLEQAEIVANVVTKYHTITEATVSINARRDYTAEGEYQFLDAEGEGQNIHFNNIRVDAEFQTIASGLVGESQGFTLDPYFEFKGEGSIEANKLGMYFKGGTRLIHECDLMKPWLAFSADIDPADVMIPINDKVKGYDKSMTLTSGVSFSNARMQPYNLFLGPKNYHSDEMIVTAKGFLKYNEDEGEYQISSKEKLNESSFAGNLIALNTETCDLRGDGKMTLSTKLGQVKMLTAGEVTSTMEDKKTNMATMMTFDFMLENSMWKYLAQTLAAAELEKVVISETYYEKGISEFVDKKTADKLISELNLFGKLKKVPNEFTHDMVFSDVNMVWNNKTQSFISDGAIGIGLIEKTQIDKYVSGYIEVVKRKKKQALNIYLELDGETWFYFNYSKGIMKVASSDAIFTSAINNVKEAKRSNKGTKKTGPYTYMQASELMKKKFVTRIESGIKAEEASDRPVVEEVIEEEQTNEDGGGGTEEGIKKGDAIKEGDSTPDSGGVK
ncbi:MAG: hypothetical protein ACJA0Q_000664 [Saprospiraceae bacterium]|jgi:hypothetical protein